MWEIDPLAGKVACARALTVIRTRIESGDMDDPRTIVEYLTKSGMTETEISDELKKLGVDVTQATINRIKSGVHKSTKYEIGLGLVRLYEQRQA